MTEGPFEEGTDPVKVTLKAGTGYDAPWVTISGKSVKAVHDLMEAADGADLMQLMKVVSGATKAFNKAWTNQDLPGVRTQGKPAAADTPSPQAGQDPYAPAGAKAEDDAPPWGEQKPATPTCKHGTRKAQPHKGKMYYTCASDLPRGHEDRCAVVEV